MERLTRRDTSIPGDAHSKAQLLRDLRNHVATQLYVFEWTRSGPDARVAERAQICAGLAKRLPLLNVEAEFTRGQWQLL